MALAILPILAIIIGLLMWALVSNPVLNKAGMIIFACGVLVTLLVFARYTVKVG